MLPKAGPYSQPMSDWWSLGVNLYKMLIEKDTQLEKSPGLKMEIGRSCKMETKTETEKVVAVQPTHQIQTLPLPTHQRPTHQLQDGTIQTVELQPTHQIQTLPLPTHQLQTQHLQSAPNRSRRNRRRATKESREMSKFARCSISIGREGR